MFFSTHEGVIDAKGRVSVPAPFRAALGGEDRIYVWPAYDGRVCLVGGGEALLNHYRQVLRLMNPHDPACQAITHKVFGIGAELKMDEPGRVRIPEGHLAAAGIKTKLIFTGAFERFCIWSPERFAEYDAEMSAQAVANLKNLDAPFQAALAAGAISGNGGAR